MPYQQVFGDCNPQGPGHWLYRRVQAKKTTMLFSRHEDNPALYDQMLNAWTDAGTAYLERLDALSGFRRDRLRFGLWTAAEGVVYPAFNRQTHVREIDCTGWGKIATLDVGTRNPTALLTIRYSGDRIHIEREFYERGLSSDSITDAAVRVFDGEPKPEFLVIDPSAAGLIASLQGRDLSVRKGINDVIVGISRVSSVLGDLTIDPSCVNTIEEFESYRYPDGRRASTDSPIKENDHAMDSLRYGIMELARGFRGDWVLN